MTLFRLYFRWFALIFAAVCVGLLGVLGVARAQAPRWIAYSAGQADGTLEIFSMTSSAGA
jgi:hypothetical protein